MSQPVLTIASLLRDPRLKALQGQWLGEGRYRVVELAGLPPATDELEQGWDGFDALLLEQGALPLEALSRLRAGGAMLPAVVVGPLTGQLDYHEAEVHLSADQMEQLSYSIDAAIARFLEQEATRISLTAPRDGDDVQWRLSNRLKERLGYLGVFYKRDPSRFLRNLPTAERQELLQSLERTYRDLLISYFRDPAAANQALESFVNTAFFSDLPTTRTVEIHANLIDAFWKTLKLGGHKSDFLKDYRLALLDVMAHLCEMYRRSLPSESEQREEVAMPAPAHPSFDPFSRQSQNTELQP